MSGELKLSLENFQSISSGELVFERGLNFIIGQSNSGKSATFRALKACLSNPAGSQRFIKRDTSKASVCINYEGNEIIWTRTSKESNYTINGESYVKTGRSNAFKILENGHIGFVRDDNDVIMNIEEELQLPFPFGLSGTDLFRLYENVFCVSDSAIIIKGAKDQETTVKDDIASLELELTKSRVKLNSIASFKDFVDLERLKSYKELLQNSGKRLSVLKEGRDIIDKAVALDKSDTSFIEYPVNDLLGPLKNKMEVKRTLVKTKRAHKAGKLLQDLVIDTKDLTQEYMDLKELVTLRSKISMLEEYSLEPKEFQDRLEEYNNLLSYKGTIQVLKKLDNVEFPIIDLEDKLVRYKELKEIKSLIKNMKSTLQEKKKEHDRLSSELKEKEDKLKEYKVCPLCQRALE